MDTNEGMENMNKTIIALATTAVILVPVASACSHSHTDCQASESSLINNEHIDVLAISTVSGARA